MAATTKPTTAQPAATTVNDQVASIQQAVERNRIASEKLHASWLGWLRTLAGLVCILSFVQVHAPWAQCWKDESYSYAQGMAIDLTLVKTALLASRDSLEYILAIITSFFIMAFLNAPKVGFDGAWKLSTACTLLTLVALVFRKQLPQTSCIQFADPSFVAADPPVNRSLPVVIVFHIIASVCVGVMRLQQRIHQRNAVAVEKLRQDVLKSKKTK